MRIKIRTHFIFCNPLTMLGLFRKGSHMRDYHNNDLVADVTHFINDDKLKGMITDFEWLEEIAKIVEKRKITIGSVDCTTGLRYESEGV